MNHKFQLNPLDNSVCGHANCHRKLLDHTSMATCEACDFIGECDLMGTMLLCPKCIEAEKRITAEKEAILREVAEHQTVEKQTARLEAHYENRVLREAASVDEAVKTVGDLFVANVVPIPDIKAAIDGDDSITDKNFAFAEALTKRINHLKDVVFDASKQLIEINQYQRDLQVHVNQLTNKLREEQREKLKLINIEYQPGSGKAKKTNPKIAAKKFEREELAHYAKELDMPMPALQMLCVKRNWKPAEAYKFLKAQLGQ